MSRQESGVLVIYKSTDDCQTWEVVKPADVPRWAQDPVVLGRMVDGEAARDETSEAGEWYMAAKVLNDEDAMLIAAARAKRIRRLDRNIRVLQ